MFLRVLMANTLTKREKQTQRSAKAGRECVNFSSASLEASEAFTLSTPIMILLNNDLFLICLHTGHWSLCYQRNPFKLLDHHCRAMIIPISNL